MKKYIILILLLLVSTLGFSQTTGKVKIGSIVLRDSSGFLIVDAPIKVNRTQWINITDLDTAIVGDGLKIKNGKLDVLFGRGLNISGDTLVYTGSNTINVDGQKIILKDDGTYSINPYIEFDSIGVGNIGLKETTDGILSLTDSLSVGNLYLNCIYISGTNQIIKGGFNEIEFNKLTPYPIILYNNNTKVFQIDYGYGAYFYTNLSMSNGRIEGYKGTDITADTTIVLGNGNYFNVTTSVGLTLKGIDNINWQEGSMITLKFDGGITLKYDGTCYGNVKPFFLSKTMDYTTQPDDIFTFVYDGTYWRETSRAVN